MELAARLLPENLNTEVIHGYGHRCRLCCPTKYPDWQQPSGCLPAVVLPGSCGIVVGRDSAAWLRQRFICNFSRRRLCIQLQLHRNLFRPVLQSLLSSRHTIHRSFFLPFVLSLVSSIPLASTAQDLHRKTAEDTWMGAQTTKHRAPSLPPSTPLTIRQ